jgi:hypothetical protein
LVTALTAGRFEGTMSALLGSKRFRPSLRFVVFDVRVLLGTDLRGRSHVSSWPT